MTEFFLTARPRGEAEEYLPLADLSLSASRRLLGGSGAAEDPYEIEFTIANTADAPWEGVIRLSMPIAAAEPRYYLPAFLYGTNRGEAPLVVDSPCPRLREQMTFPASPFWMMRSDRLSHPAAFVYGENRVVGFAASPYFVHDGKGITPWMPGVAGEFVQYAGFGCALVPREISYTLGYENAPWLFIESHNALPRAVMGENCFCLAAGEQVRFTLWQFDLPAEDERALYPALRWVYDQFHTSPRRLASPKQAVADIAGAIAEDAWLPEHHCYSGFVYDRGDHHEYNVLPSISWTNGLAAAVPMLTSGWRLGRMDMREQALDAIGHIVAHSLNPRSGLPYMVEQNGVWSNHGWWYDRLRTPGHAAYLVGQCVYLLLKAYAAEQKYGGICHEDWLDFARGILSRTEKTRNSDGEYPYVLSAHSGAGLEYDSFSGVWCMAAAAMYMKLTGEREWLRDILHSEAYYHDRYVRHLECYGGPLDIDKGIDSEGILAYIRAVRLLHEITGDPALLDHMKDALYYEFTFKYSYNSPVKVPPLSTIGWSSCGGSITSVTNPHIHPMSSSVMDEMVYYLSKREDAYVAERLRDTVLWSCQTYNSYDKEYGYGKKGWMSERFCHSEGLVKEHYPDGTLASTWFALMPWACGSILEGLTGDVWEKEDL